MDSVFRTRPLLLRTFTQDGVCDNAVWDAIHCSNARILARSVLQLGPSRFCRLEPRRYLDRALSAAGVVRECSSSKLLDSERSGPNIVDC